MRRLFWLPRLVIAVWLSWLALLGLLAGMLIGGAAWHPHFLPVTAVLGALIAAGTVLVGRAAWQIARGPRRHEAVSCLLLGVAPLAFLAGHVFYAVSIGDGRYIPLDVPLKLLIPLAESVMDLEARIRYPQWTLGDKVVMLSTPVANARAQVAAMDRHVRQLEARLGRPTRGSIHWARGPLLGLQGRADFGHCMGSGPDTDPVADGLAPVDRHEVAHCVLLSHCPPEFDPPAILTEGWAEANSGRDRVELAKAAWVRHLAGDDLSLRDFVGPDWYYRSELPAYFQGAPLVNYILDRYGPDRFVLLYTTCGRSTFADDCRRILGVSLDELDAAYQAEVEQLATRDETLERLERLELGASVTAADWKAFLAEAVSTAARFRSALDHIRLTAAITEVLPDGERRVETESQRLYVMRSGPIRSLRFRWPDSETAYLAHPQQSFQARRIEPNGPWQIEDNPKLDPERAYRSALATIDRLEESTLQPPALGSLSQDLENNGSQHLVVTRLERFTLWTRPFVHLRIEDHSPADRIAPWRAVSYVLAADDLLAVRSCEYEDTGSKGYRLRTEVAYDRHDGIPVLRSIDLCLTSPEGSKRQSKVAVVERQFGPVPDEEFAPERLLDGPRAHKVVEHVPLPENARSFADWYWVLLIVGAVCLVGGILSFGAQNSI